MSCKKYIPNKIIYVILAIIILAGIVRFSYAFFVEKEGTHSDEEWSYGLANSYYEPYIHYSDDSVYYKNINTWTSCNTFSEYLTVQEGEQFSFDSVYYNLSCDAHPPLYFYILHFLSSFFIDQYVPALAFIINIVCYIILSVFLYKLILLITKSRFAALIGVLFNTFTNGTLSMVIFMRHYLMATMFGIIFVYMIAKIYYLKEYRKQLYPYIELTIVTLLGALTHHFFLAFAFIITAILCVYWLIKRDFKVLFKLSAFILLGVILSFALFPATLDHVFGIETITYADTQTEYQYEKIVQTDSESITYVDNYEWVIFKFFMATCAINTFRDNVGFSPFSQYKRGILTYIPIVLLVLILLVCAISFLFRKESRFINLKNKSIKALKELPHKSKVALSSFNWLLFSLFISIIFIFATVSLNVNILHMRIYFTRYLFIIYPVFNLLIVIFLFWLFKKIFKKSKKFIYGATSVILAVFLVLSNCFTENVYLFKGNDIAEQIAQLPDNSDFIIIGAQTWFLTACTPVLYEQSGNYFYTTEDYLYDEDVTEKLINNSSDNPIYLILDTSGYISEENDGYDSINYIKSLEITENFEFICKTMNNGASVEIYRIR